MKSILLVFALLSVTVGLSGCAGVSNGEMAPDFEAELIDGSDFKLSDLRGQYVLLRFWGSWCGPCRMENRELIPFYNKHREHIQLVTVALEKDDSRWRKAAKKDGFTWKYQIVEQSPVVLASAIARSYGVSNIPAKFLIRPDGTLISGLQLDQMDALLSAEFTE